MKQQLGNKTGLMICGGIYFLLTAAFAVICSRFLHGRALMIAVIAVELALAPAFVAFFAGDTKKTFLSCLAITLGGALTVAAASFFGAATLTGALLALIVLLAFSLLIASFMAYIRAFGGEPFYAQFVSLIVAALMLGSIFYGNSLIAAHSTPAGRQAAVKWVINVNPVMAVAQSLLDFDLLRWQMMYDRFSVIGGHYKYVYPAWWKVSLGYLAAAVVFFAASRIRGRKTLKEVASE